MSRPHAGEAQINTDFVRLLRNKNAPSFVLSDVAHVEAFPLFLMGESARMHSGISLMEREPSFLPQCSTIQEKMAQCKRRGNYAGSGPGHPLMGQKLHPCYLHVTLNFI